MDEDAAAATASANGAAAGVGGAATPTSPAGTGWYDESEFPRFRHSAGSGDSRTAGNLHDAASSSSAALIWVGIYHNPAGREFSKSTPTGDLGE